MIINEPEIAAHAINIVKKLWGVEYWCVNTESYCMKYLKVMPGFQSSIHSHKVKDETFVGLQGSLRVDIHAKNGDIKGTHAIEPGICYRVKPGTLHSFQAINPTWVMEVSTYHSDSDVVRLRESKKL